MKKNIFSEMLTDEHGEYYIGYTNNNKTEFYIDAENFNNVKNYCWHDRIDNGVRRLCARVNGKKLLMHQFLGFKNYDHIDRNELNNRKYNLRECTHRENCQNRGMYSNNTSGIIGVYWVKSLQKWTVRIQIDGKNTNLGNFNNKEDAIRTRLQAEKDYYKEFAPQKHLFKEYRIEE